jgi:MFS family permease
MSNQRLPSAYHKVFTASVVSNLGNGVSAVAYPWVASSLTRSPILLSLIGLMSTLPWLLFSLPAGVFIDRFPRRSVIVVTDVFRGIVTAIVAFTLLFERSHIHLLTTHLVGVQVHTNIALYCLLLVASFLLSCGVVLGNGASQTFVPMIVEGPLLEKANGRMWSAESVADQFIGPPLASLLLGFSIFAPLLFDAASFFGSAGLIGLIASTLIRPQVKSESVPDFRREIKEGLSWLWQNTFLRNLAIILGAFNFITSIFFSVFILFAQEDLHTTVFTYGLLVTGTAVGGTLGGIFGPKLTKKLGRGKILGFALVVNPTISIAMALSSRWEIAWALGALEMFAAICWNVVTVTLRQEIIPDRLLGRVNSAYRFFGLGTQPLGALLGGALVSIGAHHFARTTALRLPLYAAGAFGILMAIFAMPHLTTTKIEAARSAGK